jgi:hypothetical protein
MKLASVLARLRELETALAAEYRAAAERQAAEHDVHHQLRQFAKTCDEHAGALARAAGRHAAAGEDVEAASLPTSSAPTGVPLLDELRSLFLAAAECSLFWTLAGQAARAVRDGALLDTVTACHGETELQAKWLVMRVKLAAPQALVVG